MTDAIIVGAGHNGLVTACYLAKAGLDVLVLEATASIGGMTSTVAAIPEAPEHRLNECALDVMFMRAATVVQDLGLRQFGYDEIEVDPAWIMLDPDGDDTLAIWRDPRRTAEEIRRFSPRDAAEFLRFARTIDSGMATFLPLMLTHPTRPDVGNLLASAGTVLRHPRHTAEMMSLLKASAADAIAERFEHPLVQSVVAGLVGTIAPLNPPGTAFPLIAFGLLHRLGTARIVGGTGSLPAALERCLTAAGGRVRTSAPVAEFLVRRGRVEGVRLRSGEELKASTVVSSCDPVTTLTRLLPEGNLPDRLAQRVKRIPTGNHGAGSLKVQLALSGQLTLRRYQSARADGVDLRQPVAFMGTLDELRRAFHQVEAGLLPDEPIPFCGVIPTAVDPSQAPEGQDTCYLWTFCSPVKPVEPWGNLKEAAGKTLLAQAARYYDGIAELEIGRLVETPPDLAQRTGATDGHPLHVDIGPLRSGPFRPAFRFGGYQTPIAGLYLTGAGTHPGPGISGIPGQLAARTVLRCLKTGRTERKGVT